MKAGEIWKPINCMNYTMESISHCCGVRPEFDKLFVKIIFLKTYVYYQYLIKSDEEFLKLEYTEALTRESFIEHFTKVYRGMNENR